MLRFLPDPKVGLQVVANLVQQHAHAPRRLDSLVGYAHQREWIPLAEQPAQHDAAAERRWREAVLEICHRLENRSLDLSWRRLTHHVETVRGDRVACRQRRRERRAALDEHVEEQSVGPPGPIDLALDQRRAPQQLVVAMARISQRLGETAKLRAHQLIDLREPRVRRREVRGRRRVRHVFRPDADRLPIEAREPAGTCRQAADLGVEKGIQLGVHVALGRGCRRSPVGRASLLSDRHDGQAHRSANHDRAPSAPAHTAPHRSRRGRSGARPQPPRCR